MSKTFTVAAVVILATAARIVEHDTSWQHLINNMLMTFAGSLIAFYIAWGSE